MARQGPAGQTEGKEGIVLAMQTRASPGERYWKKIRIVSQKGKESGMNYLERRGTKLTQWHNDIVV